MRAAIGRGWLVSDPLYTSRARRVMTGFSSNFVCDLLGATSTCAEAVYAAQTRLSHLTHYATRDATPLKSWSETAL